MYVCITCMYGGGGGGDTEASSVLVQARAERAEELVNTLRAHLQRARTQVCVCARTCACACACACVRMSMCVDVSMICVHVCGVGVLHYPLTPRPLPILL
jgi:hypothetical protein